MSNMIRQGDVLLIPVEFPENANVARVGRVIKRKRTKKGDPGGIILAAGEATGHHHRIAAKGTLGSGAVRERTFGGQRYVTTGVKGAQVTHEEHDTIQLPPTTTFRIQRQREFVPPEPTQPQARPQTRTVFD